jgi:hypothetical protein
VQVSEGIHRRTRITPGSPNGPAPRRARRCGSTAPTSRPRAPDGLNEDGAQALASLDALLGIEADLLLPGHGDPWTEGVTEAVRRAKAAGRS